MLPLEAMPKLVLQQQDDLHQPDHEELPSLLPHDNGGYVFDFPLNEGEYGHGYVLLHDCVHAYEY